VVVSSTVRNRCPRTRYAPAIQEGSENDGDGYRKIFIPSIGSSGVVERMQTDSQADGPTGWESSENDSTDSSEGDTAAAMETVEAYRTTQDDGEQQSLSLAVVEALSEAQDVSPVEMEQPLYDVIDPDALDSLFTADDADGRLVFAISGYEVTVSASGDVFVREYS
jgi:hypothetical protein